MKVEAAKKLLPLVNDAKTMELLEVYTSGRIEYLRVNLEQCQTAEEMYALQGSIKELRRFATLQGEVRQRAKD